MKYYILTIEQIIKDGALTEYANVKKYNSEQSALTKYYEALSNVSADLGENHTYMNIKIISSQGQNVKEETVGEYMYYLPTDEPVETDEE